MLGCAALLLAATLASTAAIADPVAVIAAVKGKVEVTSARGGPAQRVAFGRPLERGDRLVAAPGGSATLFFNDGSVVELGEKRTVKIGGGAGGKSTGTPGLARCPKPNCFEPDWYSPQRGAARSREPRSLPPRRPRRDP